MKGYRRTRRQCCQYREWLNSTQMAKFASENKFSVEKRKKKLERWWRKVGDWVILAKLSSHFTLRSPLVGCQISAILMQLILNSIFVEIFPCEWVAVNLIHSSLSARLISVCLYADVIWPPPQRNARYRLLYHATLIKTCSNSVIKESATLEKRIWGKRIKLDGNDLKTGFFFCDDTIFTKNILLLPSLADENAIAIAYKREHRQRLQEYGHTRRSHKVSVLLLLSELICLNFKLRESN